MSDQTEIEKIVDDLQARAVAFELRVEEIRHLLDDFDRRSTNNLDLDTVPTAGEICEAIREVVMRPISTEVSSPPDLFDAPPPGGDFYPEAEGLSLALAPQGYPGWVGVSENDSEPQANSKPSQDLEFGQAQVGGKVSTLLLPIAFEQRRADRIRLGDIVFTQEYVILVAEVDRIQEPGYTHLRSSTGALLRIPHVVQVSVLQKEASQSIYNGLVERLFQDGHR